VPVATLPGLPQTTTARRDRSQPKATKRIRAGTCPFEAKPRCRPEFPRPPAWLHRLPCIGLPEFPLRELLQLVGTLWVTASRALGGSGKLWEAQGASHGFPEHPRALEAVTQSAPTSCSNSRNGNSGSPVHGTGAARQVVAGIRAGNGVSRRRGRCRL